MAEVKPSDALDIALRTNDRQAWKLAKRMAHVEIGRFAVAAVIGIEAHLKREELKKLVHTGGMAIDLLP